MIILPLLFFAILVGIDQGIKYITLIGLKPISNIDIINNFFSLTYVENRGAAFGLLEGGKWLFVLLTVIVCVGLAIYYSKLAQQNRLFIVRISIVLICAGAVGNAIDRIFRGFVVDMLNFNIFGYDFPVFNFADICVCVGAFLLVVGIMFFDKNKEEQ